MQYSVNAKRMDAIKDQKWQGKLVQTRWMDTDLVDCVSSLYRWQIAPTNTIAGLFELYETTSTNKVIQPEQDTKRHHKRCNVPNVPRMPRRYST